MKHTRPAGPLTRDSLPPITGPLPVVAQSPTGKTITVALAGRQFDIRAASVSITSDGRALPLIGYRWDIVNGHLTCRSALPGVRKLKAVPPVAPGTTPPPPTGPSLADLADRIDALKQDIAVLTGLVADLHDALFTPNQKETAS